MFDLASLKAVQDTVKASEVPTISLPDLPIIGSFQTGSVYFFGEGADVDVVVLVYDRSEYGAALTKDSWTSQSSNEYEDARFVSYRRGVFNLLVTDEPTYYQLMLIARDLCKRMAVSDLLSKDKQHRVVIHKAIKGELRNV